MEHIKLIYIDDKIDPVISKNLSMYRKDDINIKVRYDEVKFDLKSGYESLIRDSRVNSANVILIDSQLFQNSTVTNGKYTGEQFKLILKKIFPYIEVIVITQNEIPDEFTSTIAKYNPKKGQSADEYYGKVLNIQIDEAIKRVCEYRAILADIKSDPDTSYIIDKINNSLDGIDAYDELKKSDIDKIVDLFMKLQENLDGGL